MKYQIDQSIKIEDTNKTTYVCIANGKLVLSSISSKEKQILKLYFRKLGKPLIFKLFTFSVLCAETIIRSKPQIIFIDKEYLHHERQIKSFILQILRIEGLQEPDINFKEIGKGSSAHKGAYGAMSKKTKGITVLAKDVLRYYEKVNKK